jgi:metallo-beta-lactamase family protein
VQHFDTSILFSGDLGRPVDPIMRAPHTPPTTDYYVVESTYGNRLHENIDPLKDLGSIINKTIKRGGTVVIPAFAVGRAQSILYDVYRLKLENIIPSDIPLFIDSPMATDVTRLFYKHAEQHRLTKEVSEAVCKTAKYIHTPEESMALNTIKMPMIIISASGMATGGRVLHHIKNLAPDHRNSIVFCGFQASGTRGDRMLSGEKNIKMFGEMIPVRAEVIKLDNLSAHADYSEILDWLSAVKKIPRKVFVTHGEASAALSLKEKIEDKLDWQCIVPSFMDEFELV